jgi:hypothetical protein
MVAFKEDGMSAFRIIEGTFHVKSYSPDGDSIRFRAKDPAHWNSFNWKSDSNKKSLHKQLRIEAIDALETHYEGYHQPRTFALGALEYLLELLGITGVKYSLSVTHIVDARDKTPGFIATGGLDGNDRPISYVFPADTSLSDGASLEHSQLPIDESVNFLLARAGLVYPTFYTTTDAGITDKIRAVVARARGTRRGIWAIDRTSDFTLWDTRTIQEDILILPKLFRRLVAFFDGHGDFDELKQYLDKQKDNLVLRDGRKYKSLAELMTIEDRRIRLNVPPEEILFNPKG